MVRRNFLKSALAGSAARVAARAAIPFPKRRYRDSVELSIVGFGGIVVIGMEQKDADANVARAFDSGVNYFDVAPTYGDGEAEQKLGPALRPYRDKVFLACKTTKRDAAGAREELERSLSRLYTDHFDLYQFHGVHSKEEVERILGPGGAAETFRKARQEGKVRYLGCSAHTEEAALALIDGFPLDSVLFPINFVSYANSQFGARVIARAKEKGIARLALKALAHTPFQGKDDPLHKEYPKAWYRPCTTPELATKALRFTLSEDVTAAIPPGDAKSFWMAVDIASSFKPLTESERGSILAEARGTKPLFPIAG